MLCTILYLAFLKKRSQVLLLCGVKKSLQMLFYYLLIYLFIYGCAVQHVGSWFPDRGWNPCPLQWEVKASPLDGQGSPCRC